ncbi:aminotransferase class III-fold pyridoxal phosphate-dependent enzyme [Aeromicrobium sp. CTD01-1L150]|uniref:aminotransferase class III-fold pyridoxal phosphate-dependent enzyme n=1 Tax=Aeromicrobium sp. CTD01-1L150 TaxID=3341830 RepID=UPI0035BF30BE
MPPTPPFAVSGTGAYLTDQFDHRVIDCNNNYTALIHGHAFAPVQDAVRDQLPLGTAFGLPTETEVLLAEALQHRTALPRWRFSNSGTEAVMTAIRAARAATGRDIVVRFAGSYHGTADAVVSSTAPGVPQPTAEVSIALEQGDATGLRELMARRGHEVAAVLVDLMPNRAGLVPADPGFVDLIRQLTHQHGALMIVDEIITFRLAEGGLHRTYDVQPDLVTVGKAIGGGFPIGGVGGRREVMEVFDPSRDGAVGWGGTFSANPISMVAGRVALEHFSGPRIDELNRQGDALMEGLLAAGISATGQGSLVRLREQVDLSELWWDLYQRGVLVGTNGLLALSTPMVPDDIDTVLAAVCASIRSLKGAPA